MTYTTAQGDMWDGIAYRLYGDCKYKDRLMRANIAYHETYIFPSGVVLDVPALETSEKPSELPPWRRT